MGLLTGTDRSYYAGAQQYTAVLNQTDFTIDDFAASISSVSDIWVYVNGSLLAESQYSWVSPTVTLATASSANDQVYIVLKDHKFGGYRYTSLSDIVTNFMTAYVGDGKIINRAKRRDVLFWTKRAIQEFSYDISRVEKIQEVEVGPSLSIPMPRDYVNYVSLSAVDSKGIEHPLSLGRITSNPSSAIAQDQNANYTFDGNELVETSPVTEQRFKELGFSEISGSFNDSEFLYTKDYFATKNYEQGNRIGGEPELMNRNGMFTIDESTGMFHFSSNLTGVIITIKYVSDGLGTDEEMKVHKLAEEAIYKYVAHAILSTLANVPEYIVNRHKKERRAAMRNAKIRLYSIKLPEMTNVMRGGSKIIKH